MKLKIKFRFVIIALLFIGFNSCKDRVKKDNSLENKSKETITVVDSHNSANSLDWDGVYKGTLPCADCEGIETTLTLNKDKTFTQKSKYLGKENFTKETKGTFTWNDDGSEITLSSEDKTSLRSYKVGENKLWHLDNDGNIVKGDLAEFYILKKP